MLLLESRNLATRKTLAASGEPQTAFFVFHGWKGNVYVVRPNETTPATLVDDQLVVGFNRKKPR